MKRLFSFVVVTFTLAAGGAPAGAAASAAPASPPGKAPKITPSNAPVTEQAAPGSGKRPLTVMLRREWEPRQRAFSFLVPDGWLVEGGMFSIDPTQAGGAGNSVDTKCDLAVKRDRAGSVMVRWLPSYNYADFSGSPEFAMTASLFPYGRNYNGMQVRPLPAVEAFLLEGLRGLRPQATGIQVAQRVDLPELVQICDYLARGVNQQVAMLGKPPMKFTAGALVVDYTEGGTPYREAISTALTDWRATAAIWNNQFSFMMRAPREEADRWKPVLDIVRQSIQINQEWLARYVQASGERGATVAETLRYLARLDQEIFERRSKTRSDIQHENYLLLTGQEEFVNPFTKEIERDTSDYKNRWTTANGHRFYAESELFDPNRDPEFSKLEWQRTPVRPR
ncbi:MAG: hypothetical protein AB9869_12435 [Verrucomicrobiia bacterium]